MPGARLSGAVVMVLRVSEGKYDFGVFGSRVNKDSCVSLTGGRRGYFSLMGGGSRGLAGSAT